MLTLLCIEFPFPGPFGARLSEEMQDLAASIAEEPGLIWKIWTESPEEKRAGGIYLFRDRVAARRYEEIHSARLSDLGMKDINIKCFQVNEGLTTVTRGPLE
ncbi:MAG: monooxygenase [Candidatus Thiodiazotropha sp.]